jgi:hypothetical protein
MDDDPSRTRTELVRRASDALPAVLLDPGSPRPSGGRVAGTHTCCVCGKKFTARRPGARACGGRCRMQASRSRRVSHLVALIEATETRIAASEEALGLAREALSGLRELAALGSSKVMP